MPSDAGQPQADDIPCFTSLLEVAAVEAQETCRLELLVLFEISDGQQRPEPIAWPAKPNLLMTSRVLLVAGDDVHRAGACGPKFLDPPYTNRP